MGDKGNKKTLELIQNADWDDIYPRAIKFALSKLFFKSGTTQAGNRKIVEAECIVQEAITKIIKGSTDSDRGSPKKGRRMWDPDRGPLLPYLLYVIKSDISHLYESDQYKLTTRMPAPSDAGEDPVEIEELLKRAPSYAKHAADNSPDPPQPADEAIIEEEVRTCLLKQVEGDDVLESIVLCMTYGVSKPKDIAEYIGITVESVNNAKKRLRRKFQSLLHEKNKEIA